MSRKSFTTYAPTEEHAFDINGTVFRLNTDVPGYVIVDFMAQADDDDASSVATMLNAFFSTTILADDFVVWEEFVRDPANHVGLATLTDIAAHIASVLMGNDQDPNPLPAPSLPG